MIGLHLPQITPKTSPAHILISQSELDPVLSAVPWLALSSPCVYADQASKRNHTIIKCYAFPPGPFGLLALGTQPMCRGPRESN
jgi:hypothetical protein